MCPAHNYFFYLTLACHIWHMHLPPWEDINLSNFCHVTWAYHHERMCQVHSWSWYDIELWPEGQIYRVYDMVLCSGLSFFVLRHSHTSFSTYRITCMFCVLRRIGGQYSGYVTAELSCMSRYTGCMFIKVHIPFSLLKMFLKYTFWFKEHWINLHSENKQYYFTSFNLSVIRVPHIGFF